MDQKMKNIHKHTLINQVNIYDGKQMASQSLYNTFSIAI